MVGSCLRRGERTVPAAPAAALPPRMRLAILSDVHGNLVALEAVLADLRTRAPDATVNLGDCATGPLWPAETWALLRSIDLPTVRGNHDRWLAEAPPERMSASERYSHDALDAAARAALGALPPTLRLDGDVLAVHGTPASDAEYLLEELVDGRLARATAATVGRRLGDAAASLVLCGHSHTANVVQATGCLVVNPGSVGFPRYAGNAAPELEEAGACHARYAVATRRGGRWSVELVALAYDWERVAARARANGRAEWAAAFLRGS